MECIAADLAILNAFAEAVDNGPLITLALLREVHVHTPTIMYIFCWHENCAILLHQPPGRHLMLPMFCSVCQSSFAKPEQALKRLCYDWSAFQRTC
jgi:hypothetical protein